MGKNSEKQTHDRLQLVTKDYMGEVLDKVYSGCSAWDIETVVSPSKRLSIVSRYAKIIELLGVYEDDKCGCPGLNVLDVGCGAGFLSVFLSGLGQVYAFDNSHNGIELAKKLFGHYPQLHLFEGDGEFPGEVPQLEGKKFDFILMREFHPLTRNIVNKRKPSDLASDYYSLLKEGGVIIIEYSLPVRKWREWEGILEVKAIAKRFHGLIVNSLSLELLLYLGQLLGEKRLEWFVNLGKFFMPFELLLCLAKSRRLSKTIIIHKEKAIKAAGCIS